MKTKRKSTAGHSKNQIKKLGLFDHVKHIRSSQDPEYFNNLSDENKKSFNHFMILRALSMDSNIVQDMAFLYKYFDKIPSPQFYKLLIALVPRQNKWVPWIKTKVVKHNEDLITLISNKLEISHRQANEYINLFIRNEEGLNTLVGICQSMGLTDKEVEKLFDKRKYE